MEQTGSRDDAPALAVDQAPFGAIIEQLEQADAGALLLIEQADDASLGALVRALLPGFPTLEVLADPSELEQLPASTPCLLRPTSAAAGWLSDHAELLAGRSLIIWLRDEAAPALVEADAALLGSASSFICPSMPVAHGVAGLLVGEHGPGVEWLGGPLGATLRATHPERPIGRISAQGDYASLVAAADAVEDGWTCWTEVDGEFRLRRVRWALAEVQHRGCSVLVEPEAPSPGWWPVHTRLAPFSDACERLGKIGALRPGRLAALAGLEPETIDLVEVLLATEAPEEEIEACLLAGSDPGAALARLALERDLFTTEDVVSRLVAPPIQRALGAEPEVKALRVEKFRKVGAQVLDNQDLPTDLLGSWAATTGAAIPVQILDWSTGQATAWLVEAALRHGPASAEDWRAVAAAAIRLGDAQVATRWADMALEFTDVDDIIRSRALYTRARADYRCGDYAASEVLLREALELQEAALGADHVEVARTLHAIGQSLNRQKRYPQALATYNRALRIEQATHGSGHADIAVTLHEIGQVMTHLSRYQEATRAFQQALEIKEATLGPHHPSTASTLHAIGQARTRQGKYKEALDAFQRDLRITRGQLGKDHPSLGPSLHSIGQTYTLMGRFEYALACFAREIKILERALGANNVKTAKARDAMGQVLTDMGRPAQAIKRYQQALSIKETHLGPDHSSTASTLYALGHTYSREGDLEHARSCFERAVDIRQRTEGPEHAYTALAWHALGQIHARQLDYASATQAFDHALGIKQKVLGTDHPETAITRFERGRAMRDSGDGDGYTEMMAATGVLVRELGQDHPMVRAARQALG